mgnify:CR=1 FL=1
MARAENAVVSVWIYLWQLVWPVHLGVFYPHPKLSLPIWLVGLALVGLLVATVVCFRLRKSYPYLIVGWLWYLGMLVPVIGLVQVGAQARADRYTYLPQVGILIMIAWGLVDLRARLVNAKPLLGGLASLTICCPDPGRVSTGRLLVQLNHSLAAYPHRHYRKLCRRARPRHRAHRHRANR